MPTWSHDDGANRYVTYVSLYVLTTCALSFFSCHTYSKSAHLTVRWLLSFPRVCLAKTNTSPLPRSARHGNVICTSDPHNSPRVSIRMACITSGGNSMHCSRPAQTLSLHQPPLCVSTWPFGNSPWLHSSYAYTVIFQPVDLIW